MGKKDIKEYKRKKKGIARADIQIFYFCLILVEMKSENAAFAGAIALNWLIRACLIITREDV